MSSIEGVEQIEQTNTIGSEQAAPAWRAPLTTRHLRIAGWAALIVGVVVATDFLVSFIHSSLIELFRWLILSRLGSAH